MIEVADTSLEKDRAKTDLYRSAGVQEYWIINVGDKTLERHRFTQPLSGNQFSTLQHNASVQIQFNETELTLDLTRIFN